MLSTAQTLDEAEPCPGEGRCHGCLGWCDRCGDVGAVCDYPECDHHHCSVCRVLITSRNESDYNRPTWCKDCEHQHEVQDLSRRLASVIGLRFYDLAFQRLEELQHLVVARLAELARVVHMTETLDLPTHREILHLKHKERRDSLRNADLCINGPRDGGVSLNGVVHGPPVKGGKCQRCVDVHERGPAAGLAEECPTCKAIPSARCTTVIARGDVPAGRPTFMHSSRIARADARKHGVELA